MVLLSATAIGLIDRQPILSRPMAHPPSNILVVGASGFIGRHLVRRFALDGCEVEAWSRSEVEAPPGTESGFRYRCVDLLGTEELPAPPDGGWDVVFQLAGESRPSRFTGQTHLRDTVRMAARVVSHVGRVSPGCRYILNSSAYVYSASEDPRSEKDETVPTGPYGLAKLIAEDLTLLHRDRLHVTIVRAFNLIGPGLPDGLFATDLLAGLRGDVSPASLNGADVQRDLLDIRDAVAAYSALLGSDYESGSVFNFCSGRAIRSSEFAGILLNELQQSRELRFEGTPHMPILGSCQKLRSLADWDPKFSIAETARSFVEVHRG